MVVRIIDPNPHPSVVKQVLCRNCGVKLEYTPADVSKRTVTDYTGSRGDGVLHQVPILRARDHDGCLLRRSNICLRSPPPACDNKSSATNTGEQK